MNHMQPVASHQVQPLEVELKPLTKTEWQRQIGIIQDVLANVMKEGVHYGKVPNTDKDTLLKPGAEKVAATFRLAPSYVIQDQSTDDEARYLIECRLTSPSGVFVGSGVGSCSTNEQKYKWRAAVCQEEFDATDDSRRRTKYVKKYKPRPGEQAFYTVMQVRQDAADLANTVLKMAAKRALVAAVLTATAASDIFAQDLDDLPPEIRDELVGDEPPPAKQAQGNRKKAPPKQPQRRQANDDAAAKKAEDSGTIRPNQVGQINSKCAALNVEPSDLIEAFGVKSLEELPASKFREALSWIDGEAGNDE